MKKVVIVVFASICSLVGLNAVAQPEMSPEEQAKQAAELRQSVKKLIAWNNQAVGDMMRRRRDFDAEVVERNAERVAMLAGMIPEVFEKDTREFDVDTLALDGIWEGKDDFDSKAQALAEAATALAAAAATGDQRQTLAAARDVGKACGSCHDVYRYKE